MTVVIVLDFSRIRPSEWPLPEIGVVDVEPSGKGNGVSRTALRGHVLELNDNASLRRPIVVPAGISLLKVRLPTGEILTQNLDLGRETDGELTARFNIAGRKEVRPRRPKDIVKAPKISTEKTPSTGERKRWAVVARSDERLGNGRLASFLNAFARDVVEEQQQFRGMARVQSEARSFLSKEHSTRKDVLSDRALVGLIAAVQPVKLYGSEDSLRTRWNRPIRDRKRVDSKENEAKTKRYFAVSYVLGNKARPKTLACIPGNWRTLDAEHFGDDALSALKVRYVTGPRSMGEAQESVRVQVADNRVQGLLEFMQTGDLYSSSSLIREAHVHLYEKTNNPYAAAAAGYVLARAGMPGPVEELGRWVYNLARWFPALPDGQVLLATLLLQGPKKARFNPLETQADCDEQARALKAVLEATHRGPPMFRLGLRLLLTNIQILKGLYKNDEEVTSKLLNAQAYVDDLNTRVDRTQAFCVFDVSGDAL